MWFDWTMKLSNSGSYWLVVSAYDKVLSDLSWYNGLIFKIWLDFYNDIVIKNDVPQIFSDKCPSPHYLMKAPHLIKGLSPNEWPLA